jgi:P-type Cu+ transporter
MAEKKLVKDPVCGMMIDPATAKATRTHAGVPWYFCAQGCAKAFDSDPAKYAAGSAAGH